MIFFSFQSEQFLSPKSDRKIVLEYFGPQVIATFSTIFFSLPFHVYNRFIGFSVSLPIFHPKRREYTFLVCVSVWYVRLLITLNKLQSGFMLHEKFRTAFVCQFVSYKFPGQNVLPQGISTVGRATATQFGQILMGSGSRWCTIRYEICEEHCEKLPYLDQITLEQIETTKVLSGIDFIDV